MEQLWVSSRTSVTPSDLAGLTLPKLHRIIKDLGEYNNPSASQHIPNPNFLFCLLNPLVSFVVAVWQIDRIGTADIRDPFDDDL